MTLGETRRAFTGCIGKLITHIGDLGFVCQIEEAVRSDEQAALNALGDAGRHQLASLIGTDARFHALTMAVLNHNGNGILMSNHRVGLAVDLSLFKLAPGGTTWVYCTDTTDYEGIGSWWETQHALARWGGRFTHPDADHFSFEWNGVR